ncbi:MAG: 50S ribosomal protein L17 [Candidatus Omnitrophota bacterium]
MRHRLHKSRLSLSYSKRKALILSLVRSVIINRRIKTTRQKAKAVRPLVESLISWGKRGDLFSRRQAYRILRDHSLVSRLFSEIAPKFSERKGGYSRIMLYNRRRGDNAEMALLELTENSDAEAKVEVKADNAKGNVNLAVKANAGDSKIKKRDRLKTKTEVTGSAEDKREERPKKKETKDKDSPKSFLGGLRRFFRKK